MKDMKTGNEHMLTSADFLDRKFLMQEMYQNYQDGEKDWDKKGVRWKYILITVISRVSATRKS